LVLLLLCWVQHATLRGCAVRMGFCVCPLSKCCWGFTYIVGWVAWRGRVASIKIKA